MSTVIRKLVAALLALSGLPAHGGGISRSRIWLDRPWEIRYILFAEEAQNRQIEIIGARKHNAKNHKLGGSDIYFDAAALLEPTATFAVLGEAPIAVVVLSFDRNGRVITKDKILRKMTARRNMLDDLVLVSEESPSGKPYYLADWSQGIPGDVAFSPAVCGMQDVHRYEDNWDIDDYTGNFGCREWTAQLNHRDFPYINVTSYAPHGNSIGEFVGWSRFTDPPKPVIVQHGKTWLCLHECPAGEKPGVIPDIRAWTTKHGYPMPERPAKQPLYPNSDYKDDLAE